MVGEIAMVVIISGITTLHVFTPNICTFFDCGNSIRIYFESITLAGMVVAGAAIGALLGYRWAPKVRNRNRLLIEGPLIFVIISITWAYTYVQNIDTEKFGLAKSSIEAIILIMIICAGAMLGAHFGARMIR